MALRFPDQLLRDAREVLRAVRTRVRTLETDIKKSGEGMGGRSAVVIFIDHDVLDEISCAGEASDQRLQASAVVDYGEHRAGVVLGGEGVMRAATFCTGATLTCARPYMPRQCG